MYEAKIAELQLQYCAVITMWLAAEDYPRLLGIYASGIFYTHVVSVFQLILDDALMGDWVIDFFY